AQAQGEAGWTVALHRPNHPLGGALAGHQAGAHLLAVDEDGAGAAVTGLAADLGAGAPQPFAQGGGERGKRRRPGGGGPPVEGEGQGHQVAGGLVRHQATRRGRAGKSSANRSRISATAALRRENAGARVLSVWARRGS